MDTVITEENKEHMLGRILARVKRINDFAGIKEDMVSQRDLVEYVLSRYHVVSKDNKTVPLHLGFPRLIHILGDHDLKLLKYASVDHNKC